MIKKYPWHFIYLIFVIICLANIFQKLKWSTPTDSIAWEERATGLACLASPPESPVEPGDILLTAQKYVITGKMDLYRVIQTRKFCLYEIEREGLLKTVGVDIINQYTPLSYYIMVFSGIFFILLTLNILNAKLKQGEDFFIPKVFLFLSLSFYCCLFFLCFSLLSSFDLFYCLSCYFSDTRIFILQ